MCERAGAPVIRVTVFTFPLRHTGAQAQAACGEGGALPCAHINVCVCVCVCVVWGCWECMLRIIALQSFLVSPSGDLMSQEGFGCRRFPLNGRGVVRFFFFFNPLFTLSSASGPSTTKVFIDYPGLLFNNLILGDSVLTVIRVQLQGEVLGV